MAILSTLTRRDAVFITTSSLSLGFWVYNILKKRQPKKQQNDDDLITWGVDKTSPRRRSASQKATFRQILDILKLVMGPKEYLYCLGIALALIAKTSNDLWLISNGTQIESAIITANKEKLKSNLGSFFVAMPTLALVSNALKYFVANLRLNLREKLSERTYRQYLNGLTYYRINTFDSDMQNVDQLLTVDIEKFCNTVVDVYTNISKPILDIIILIYKLSATYTGGKTPGAMFIYLFFAGTTLTAARRPLTRLTVKETQLEGQLRYVHSRLITNCEEVAFYQGEKKESLNLLGTLGRLSSHLRIMSAVKLNIDFLDNLIAKYSATVVGYLSLAIPFFTGFYAKESQTVRLESYYKSGRMMVKLAESIGRLELAGRDFAKLTAYTQRVSQLLKSIEKNSDSRQALTLAASAAVAANHLIPGNGEIILCPQDAPEICFEQVPLCTPNGDILVQQLNLTIKHGTNVLITGPNGCGKSSLFRLLGELWPLFGGRLIKPPSCKLFYIPQKPYLTLGTLRDQIIYPDTRLEMQSKGMTDDHLTELLNVVELVYLKERGYFDMVLDWHEVLSGGEKQRIAIARLIYHRPLYAILDECTSAVAIDVEQRVYKYITQKLKCSVLSVTHRVKQLAHFHQYELRFSGDGRYEYNPISV